MALRATEPNIQPLRRGFEAARRRFWWQRSLRAVARGVCGALGLALAASLFTAWQAPEVALQALWAASALALLAGLGAAVVMRPSPSQAARLVDHRLGLAQQLGTAEELLARRTTGRLVPAQIERASSLVGRVPISRAFPLAPKREMAVALGLSMATLAVTLLIALGVAIPNPLTALRLPPFLQDAIAPTEQRSPEWQAERDLLRPSSPALDPARQAMEELRRQAQQGSLSAAAAAALLAQANAELNRVASESRMRQEALENLAEELRRTAAGREVATSLRQGDHDQAAEQLREIGQDSDQLSAAAKRELAEALNRSAARSQAARDLAASERNAAQALEQDHYSDVVESMDQLAESVLDAADQMVPQSELAQSWQELEKLAQQLGALGPQSERAHGALSPPVAQGPQAPAERAREMQQGSQGDGQGMGMEAGTQEGDMPGQQPGIGPQPGDGRGGPPLGEQHGRLGPDGSELDVQGEVGDSFPGEGDPSSEPPSVLRQGRADIDSSSDTQGPSSRTTVPAENVLVPGERRSTIREYFSRGAEGQ